MAHCVGDVCMVLGDDEPDCPALILERRAEDCLVHYYGWGSLWDESVPLERIRPPSDRCARLMAEIDALEGLYSTPPTGHVRHVDDSAVERGKVAVGAVIDRAVRQITEDGAMHVMYYLEHVDHAGSTKYDDTWYPADGLQAASRLATGYPLAIDVTERLEGDATGVVRLRLAGDELWVCMVDWLKFATRGAMASLSAPAALKETFAAQRFGASNAVQAFPVSVLGSVLRWLPLEHARRHRQSGDAEWLRSSIARELSVMSPAPTSLTPRTVQLPRRTEVLKVPGPGKFRISVHVVQGGQPLVDASDFFRLVNASRKGLSGELVAGFCQALLTPSGDSSVLLATGGKPALPGDLCGLALDKLVDTGFLADQLMPASKVGRFRSCGAWRWLRDQLAELTDVGSVRTTLATASTHTDVVPVTVDDTPNSDSGYEPVDWSLVESERGLERLTQPVWSEEAEGGLSTKSLRTKTDAKYMWAASEKDDYMKKGVSMDAIERVLDPSAGHRMEDLIGIGRITDRNHPVLRCHNGPGSAFLLYAMRDLPPFTVVGEYVGDILSDAELSERQQSAVDDKTDNYSMVIYTTASKGAKSKGATIWTSDRTNELILANDWREDVLDARESDNDGNRRKQNLNPVEVVSCEDGKPHILYVVGEEAVSKGEELLIDYGEEYWMCFRSEFKWTNKLKLKDDALAHSEMERRKLERRIKELKARADVADAEVQTEPPPSPVRIQPPQPHPHFKPI